MWPFEVNQERIFGPKLTVNQSFLISKAEIKRIQKLHSRKGRQDQKSMLIEGLKLLEEALLANVRVHQIFATDDQIELPNTEVKVTLISAREMKAISQFVNPSPIAAVVDLPELWTEPENASVQLMLDGLRDPGNLGTIVRTADWFGVKNVVLSSDCVDPFNSKVVQSTMGSIFRVRLAELDLIEHARSLTDKGFEVCAAAMDGQTPSNALAKEKVALIIGSESHGIRKELMAVANCKITIPGGEKTESLNASIAASILLYEWHRWRR